MKHKRLIKQRATTDFQVAKTTHFGSSGGTSPADVNKLKSAFTGGLFSPVSPLGIKEGEIIQEIVDALGSIDIPELPPTPRGDAIRGLLWALQSLINPVTEPHDGNATPFNILLTREEALVAQGVINEVWLISCSVLCGLSFLCSRGRLSSSGFEIPACWSPGDFIEAVEDASGAMERLQCSSEKLYELRFGPLPKKADLPAPGEGKT